MSIFSKSFDMRKQFWYLHARNTLIFLFEQFQGANHHDIHKKKTFSSLKVLNEENFKSKGKYSGAEDTCLSI